MRPITRNVEAAPHPWPAIGSLMLRDGYVTKEQLEEVLRAQHDSPQQRISGWRLGELLVERGLLTQGQVAQLVAEQYELPYMDLDESRIDRSVAHLLPPEMADRFSALPIEALDDGSLVLAVSDPATVLFSDELRRTLGRPLRFTVVAPEAMDVAVASVRGEAPPERPSLSVAEWPPGAPAFGFGRDEAADSDTVSDDVSPNGASAQAPSCPPLGTLLVRDGLLTEDELESALAEQRLSEGKRLGEILVGRGTLTRTDVARVVAEQYELPFIDLSSLELDHRVGALLPHDIAQRHSALPLDFLADGSLRVAVADPTKILEPEEILAVLGARLSFAVADPDAVEAAIEQLEQHASTTTDAWAGFAPIGPPISGADERAHVDASDLIIVPAEEAAHVEAEPIERRGDRPEEHDDALVLAASETMAEAPPAAEPELHLPSGIAPEPEPEQLEHPEADADLEHPVSDEPEIHLGSTSTKRKRGWFRRRKGDHETTVDAENLAEASSTADTSPPDPIAGLLLAGEAAAAGGDATVDDPSLRATEQAAVLRLWISGDATTADTPDIEQATEHDPTLTGTDERFTEALVETDSDARGYDEADLALVGEIMEPELAATELDSSGRDDGLSALVEADVADGFAPDEPLDAETELEHDVSDLETVAERNAFELAQADSWSDTADATADDELASAHAGLPEVAEGAFVEPETTDSAESPESLAADEAHGVTQAEVWNIFAPAPVADEVVAPGEGDDAPPAELHDELAPEPIETLHDPEGEVETDLPWDDSTPLSYASHAPVEEAFDAPWEHEEPDHADELEEAPHAEALHAEAVTDAYGSAQVQPSWLSWEPAAGAADPWQAAETDADDTVDAVAEGAPVEDPADFAPDAWAPSFTDVEPEPVAPVDEPVAHEPADDGWLAEIEPDSPNDHEAPWELEDAPTAETFLADDEPSALDVVVGMSVPETAPETEHYEAPVVELAEPAPYEEPAAVDPEPVTVELPVELSVEHVDRGTLAPLVERATTLGASTVHFSAQETGVVVRARIDGVLRKLDTVTGQARFELARELGLAAQNGSLAGGHVTSLPTPHGDTVTIRFRPSGDAATLDTLSLDPVDREALERALRHSFGLVLVAGPAGSGQAATLSAALHELTSADRAVMTIEDPILHVVSGADQVAVDASAGRGYADGLRTLLSADPDAILVGELADEETARLAVDAATGHLVVTTVLAQTAVGALDRLSLLGVDTDLVASTLSLVVAQRLVRRLCDHCREGYYASAADTVALRRPEDEIGRRLLARGTGCAECGETGFSGTIGAYEILSPNDEVRALVATNAPAAELERAARLAGKRTLAEDAVRLCLEGLTTVSEVQRVLGRALL
jgi:general secretion pathway protein E